MIEKYLIYIDFLGFSDLVSRAPHEIEKIYAILNSLNVHSHNIFKSIVFSDTVLIYNRHDPSTPAEEEYIVMYSIEFVQDLQHRLIGQDIYFRAIITHGLFKHYDLENIECYYGNALINAHQKEKTIPSIGLFIDSKSNRHNNIFPTAIFNDDLAFVYINQNIERFYEKSQGLLPFDGSLTDDDFQCLAWEIRYLKDVHHNMRHHKDPSVRLKYITAWDYYAQRYHKLLCTLESNCFEFKCLSNTYDWTKQLENLERDITYFKNIAV